MSGRTHKRRTARRALAAAAGLMAAVAAALTVLAACEPRREPEAPPPAATETPQRLVVPQITSTDEENNVEIFKRASPSTVFITNTQLRRDLLTLNVFEIPRGSGTGIVWNREGYIVTNSHVVEGASRILVTLADNESYEAELVGEAPSLDLAVLRIDAPSEHLQPLPVGESRKLQVGQKVLAIGNPFGLDYTLTTGIISALGREISAPNGRRIRDVIQTDAAINPGNSGGPLMDSSGRIIGINTAIIGPGGGSAGIGFAVPIHSVAKAVPELIAHGRVIRPVLGLSLVRDEIARRRGIQGAVILEVAPGLGADKAGLRGLSRAPDGRLLIGDVIVGLERFPVDDSDDLLNALEQFKPGDTVTVHIVRDGKPMEVAAQLSAPE